MILANQSSGNPGFVIKNNVYVGSTGVLVTGNISKNYEYVSKTKLTELTSDTLPAYYLTASGSYSSLIYETCHGINYSNAINAGKTGDYNFYMAPYGPGYYQPPVGELPTFGEQTFGFSKISSKQVHDLNLPDYLKIFGLRIAGKINNFIPCKSYSLTAFHEGITDCPISPQMAFKYSEVQVELTAGTFKGSIGGNIYNHNPIPSSYDRGVLVATTLYKSATPTGAKVTKENQNSCFYEPGPTPYFSRGSSASSYNHVVGRCGNLSDIDRIPIVIGAADAHTNAFNAMPNGDALSDGDVGQDTSTYDQGAYWHFIFKNNHNVLPFGNTHEAGTMTQDNDQFRENHWWEHRECPENIDYLNHAFGNNINACPMNYVDVPYYAAIGKFGYFGTRFQNTWRSVGNDSTGDKYIDFPSELDGNGNETYSVKADEEYSSYSQNIGGYDYNPLLLAAASEKKFYDFSFSDKILFLNLNYNLSLLSTDYSNLTGSVSNFAQLYSGLCAMASVSGAEPTNNDEFKISGIYRPDSSSDDPIRLFIKYLADGPGASTNLSAFNNLIKDYGCFKCSSAGVVDFAWYDKITNQKRKRISKAYYKNIAEGNPVDLFPNSQITFAFEKTSDYANSDFIKYGSVASKIAGKSLPEVKRRYFSAGFSSSLELKDSDLYTKYEKTNDSFNGASLKGGSFSYAGGKFTGSTNNFYLGYLNPRGCGKDDLGTSTKSYLKLINLPNGGIWKDHAPETSPPPADNTNSPSRSPWPDGGFNGVGEIRNNFSCFSPMFLQQPLNEGVKLCQAPKFRVYAVDYHTIPEDKIGENRKGGYPEVGYWLSKIKVLKANGSNLYPLKHQWYRILKSDAPQYLLTKSPSLIHASDPSGAWCCAEDGFGRTSECTVIRPKECIDLNGVAISSWGHSEDHVRRFMGVKSSDCNYFYFCNVTGRFGWRSSEFASVAVDLTAKIEIASLNLCGGGSTTLEIAGLSVPVALAAGYLGDKGVYFEQVKDTSWNDTNNCEMVRFVGPEALRGVTRVYTPSTFVDSRGKRIRNAHWKNFGSLATSQIALTEAAATALYADRALPYCDRVANYLWAGVPAVLKGYVHRTNYEPALLTDNTTFGVKASKLRSISELYPQRAYFDGGPIPDWGPKNPGHHQFESNLGSIKRYSSIRSNNTIDYVRLLPDGFSTDQVRRDLLMDDFDKKMDFAVAGRSIITGPECGFVAPSLGRLMHFFVETFATYYLLCEVGGVKPKKVRNISHIAGGLRTGKPGLQYNWLGKPNDARLRRVSMPGPYAFQWKVERHNRDRSGNGMPLSFWSYHFEERMDDLYDAAAVYGAVKKTDPNYDPLTPAQITLRNDMASAMGYSSPMRLRGPSIGPDDGPKLGCGSIRWRPAGEMGGDKPNSEFVKYMNGVAGVGPDPFSVNGCAGVDSSDCFYPCISLKFPEGFVPRGGKALSYKNGERHVFTSSISGPRNTTSSNSKIFQIDLSPCSTNKKDICNYLTPTAHVGVDTWPAGNVSNNSLILASVRGS